MSEFIKFAEYFKESITTTDAGISGDGSGFSPNNSTSSDSYATGDARVPVSIFGKCKIFQRLKKKKKKKNNEESEEQRIDDKCWDGYKKKGTKMKGNKRVNNCVKEAKDAPRGQHFTKSGNLAPGGPNTDGNPDGGPFYKSDPTYVNPNASDEELEGKGDTVDITLPIELANVLHEVLMDATSEEAVEDYSDVPEEDAEYQGRKVTLNKPTRGDVKKFKVYVKDPKTGNVKKVNFGHGGTSAKRKTMRIRKSNPKARKSFRARHKCDQKKSKLTAGYWSCKKW
jgi:hypothetical protein